MRLLFVVGAGASTDFGLPIGSALVDQIRAKLHAEMDVVNGQTIVEFAMKNGNSGYFGGAARALAGGMLSARSIDRFLDSHKEDKLIADVGKCSIASCLLDCERASILGKPTNNDWKNNHLKLKALQNTWLAKLFCIRDEGVTPDNEDKIFNGIDFITFNYDRCMEEYLTLAFQHIRYLSPERASQLVKSIDITHVYGSLGSVWAGDANYIGYGEQTQATHAASKGIRIYTEGAEDGTLLKIREKVDNSNAIIFLGFSFDRLNLEALFADKQYAGNTIFATWLNINNQVKINIVHKIKPKNLFTFAIDCQHMITSDETFGIISRAGCI